MRIRNTTLAALCLAFVSVVAYSAAGDRYFSNPASNKDVVIQVNKAGVTTDVIKAVGSTGAVTVGPAASTAVHTINGALTLVGPSSNAYIDINRSGGQAWQIGSDNANPSGTGGFYFYDGTGAKYAGSVSTSSFWRLGPALGKVGILGTRVAGDAAVMGSPFGDGAHQIIGNGLQINFALSENNAQATGGMSICVLTDTDGAQSALVWAGFSASIIIISQTHAGFYVAGSPSAGQVGLTFVNTGSVLIATGGASGLVSAGLYVTCLGNAL